MKSTLAEARFLTDSPADVEIERGEFTEYDQRALAGLPRQFRERGMKRLSGRVQVKSRHR